MRKVELLEAEQNCPKTTSGSCLPPLPSCQLFIFSGDVNQDEADKISEYYKTVSVSDDCRIIICINKWGLFAENLRNEGKTIAEMKNRYIEKMNDYYSKSGNDFRIREEDVFCTDWKMDDNRRREFGISGIQDIRESLRAHLTALGISDEAQLEASVSSPSL